MENLLKNIEELREQVMRTWELLDIDRVKEVAHELEIEMGKPDFWDDQKKAIEVSRKKEENEKEVVVWENLRNEIRDLEELVAVANEEEDKSVSTDATKKFSELVREYKKQEFHVLFSERYDASNAIISIHAGTGGVDAQDWAMILERMYLRFTEKKDFKIELVEKTHGNEAGIKSVVMHVSGKWAYGNLRSESGVHRLVRISPFDAEAMRHTSFALVEVVPELPESEEIEIHDNDLKIDVYKSSGPGGQGVNTTDSAVRITHIPTNTRVSCQNERSQHQNKETAMKILKAKLLKLQIERKEREEAEIKGEVNKAEWGNQIRSYVMQPYKMVKDHRTKYETQEVDKILDGEIDEFVESYLKWKVG
jgi:peptide chain release factor 2